MAMKLQHHGIIAEGVNLYTKESALELQPQHPRELAQGVIKMV